MFYNSVSGPTGALVSVADADIASQHRYSYDGLERRTSDQLWSNDVFQWQTIIRYDGDRMAVTPPDGGTTTQEIVDARERVVERRLYASRDLAGAYDATAYRYDDLGQLVMVTDPHGNHWDYTYDLLGRVTRRADPDAGVTELTYDNAGQLKKSEDAHGDSLWYSYDELGRKTRMDFFADGMGVGWTAAEWTYDTLTKGHLDSPVAHGSGGDYTVAVTGYDDGYRPLGSSGEC